MIDLNKLPSPFKFSLTLFIGFLTFFLLSFFVIWGYGPQSAFGFIFSMMLGGMTLLLYWFESVKEELQEIDYNKIDIEETEKAIIVHFNNGTTQVFKKQKENDYEDGRFCLIHFKNRAGHAVKTRFVFANYNNDEIRLG